MFVLCYIQYRRLPPTLTGLMGEANIKSARGQYDEAVKMCEWIIRNGWCIGYLSCAIRFLELQIHVI